MSAPKTIGLLAADVHTLALSKGWYVDVDLSAYRAWVSGNCARQLDDDQRQELAAYVLSRIALMHSELSEAVEEARHDKYRMYTGANGKPEGVVVELADAVIRIMDACEALGLDLDEAIEAKHAYNATRPHRHGGRSA